MSDDEEQLKPFSVDRAKTGRANCKKCKTKINVGELRLGKLGYNPFSSGTMTLWHHVPCMFEVFKKQRKTTKKIESPDDIEGWEGINAADRDIIKSHFSAEELTAFEKNATSSDPKTPKKVDKAGDNGTSQKNEKQSGPSKDDFFRQFRKICCDIADCSSYLQKTEIVRTFFEKGADGAGFKGDLQLWCRCLLPMAMKRVYNLQSKQLVKIFSEIFRADQEAMLEHLEQGDVSDTIATYFEKSNRITQADKSKILLKDVDTFLEYLSKLTKEADQIDHFTKLCKQCTSNDLKYVIRLIKHDLRINAGPKHILEAIHPDAYKAFQTSRDLEAVVKNAKKISSDKKDNKMEIKISIMTPVRPMLAEACKSSDTAMAKCPNGLFSEIKYDGERVQLHKQGTDFKYFSRSLKPVMPHKVKHFDKYIPQAFPHGKDLILDCEILLVDTKTQQPLPFGTLGAHKKTQFETASVCLFIFDCIYFNGKSLMDKPIRERRKILKSNINEIQNHVVLSEIEEISDKEKLEDMMERVFKQGLEGLVLKAVDSKYEPGKRHWLKMKKDYLFGGAMADSADLVVLGAWYGTGKKGGIMSIFLMGCYDEKYKRWVTVTKVHGGHDDQTLEKLQTELDMVKIAKDVAKTPAWLHCNKAMLPDFVAADPKKSQVWEITGAEFTKNQMHTAEGISIRFPRVTKIRSDKSWDTATSLPELKKLYAASKDTSNFTLSRSDTAAPGKKRKADDGGPSASTSTSKNVPSNAKKVRGRQKKKAKVVEDSDSESDLDDTLSTDENSEDEDTTPSPPRKRPESKRSTKDEKHPTSNKTSSQLPSPSPKKAKLNDEIDFNDSGKSDSGTEVEDNSDPMKIAMVNELPDVFVGCGLLIPRDIPHRKTLERIVIAYGGHIRKSKGRNSLCNKAICVTHVIYPSRQTSASFDEYDGAQHVSVDWLWDGIRQKRKQPEKEYQVRFISK